MSTYPVPTAPRRPASSSLVKPAIVNGNAAPIGRWVLLLAVLSAAVDGRCRHAGAHPRAHHVPTPPCCWVGAFSMPGASNGLHLGQT